MNRLTSIATLAGFLLSGCASPQLQVPPGEDPNHLAAAIASRGSGEGQVVLDPPYREHPLADKVMKTTAVAGTAALAVGGLVGIFALAALSGYHGPLTFGPQAGSSESPAP